MYHSSSKRRRGFPKRRHPVTCVIRINTKRVRVLCGARDALARADRNTWNACSLEVLFRVLLCAVSDIYRVRSTENEGCEVFRYCWHPEVRETRRQRTRKKRPPKGSKVFLPVCSFGVVVFAQYIHPKRERFLKPPLFARVFLRPSRHFIITLWF